MTDDLVAVQPDAVLLQAQTTGKMPVHWWTSDQCWRMMAKLAGQFANSSMVPSAFRNEPGNVVVALAAGMPLGLSPLACLQSVAVINGKPTLYGDAPIAQVLAHPSLVSIDEEATGSLQKGDRTWGVCVRRKQQGGNVTTTTRSFSIDDAKRAGLWDKAGPWKSYPDRMLYNRARAYAVRDSFADVLQGVQLAADATDDMPHSEPATKPAEPAVQVLQDTPALHPVQPDDQQPTEKPAKAKRTRKATKKDAEEVQPQPAVEAVQLTYALTRNEATPAAVHYDASSDELWLSNAEGHWRMVTPSEAQLHDTCYEAACEGLRKRAVQAMLNRRMSSEDAGRHIMAVLNLDAPAKVASLTLTQLADLVNDLL